MDHNQGLNLTLQFEKLKMSPSPAQAIPMDIVSDILVRLPAKPLMRFKSVCKAWYDLINGPDFVQLHLDRSLTTQSNLHFVFATPILHLGDFDTFDNAVELGYPFKKHDIGGASIIGSCNGLLCLWNYDYYNFIVAVYNPTTRTHRIIPYLPRPSHCYHLRPTFISGFAHDKVFDDYKFVRICQCSDEETNFSYSEVMVYSLRNDFWVRVLDHVPYKLSCRCGDGVFLNGSLHWVIDTEINQPPVPLPIVGFNVSTNSFFDVPVPEIDMYLCCFMHVGVLDGCLCIVLNYLFYYEIWIMKEYGVVESWTMLYQVDKARDFDAMEKPVGFTKSRKELLVRLCLCRVTSLDLETMKIENVEVFCNPSRRWDAHVCVENLSMLDYLSDLIEIEQQEDQGTTRRRRRRRKRRGKRRRKRN